MRKKGIVMLILAVIFFLMGISALTYELELENGLAVVSGPLVIDAPASDPDVDLDLPFSYPLLTRTVEMGQYIERKDGTVRLELSISTPDRRIEAASGDEEVIYENEPFPTWIRRRAVFGSISIMSGDQKLRLHESLLSRLYADDAAERDRKDERYRVVEERPEMDHRVERYVVARKLVRDEESWRREELIDRFLETDDLAAGDVVVTWRSIKLGSLAPTYTIYGLVHDGVIGDEEHYVIIYDREMTAEELQEEYFAHTGTRTFGRVLLAICVILVVSALLPKFRSKRYQTGG